MRAKRCKTIVFTSSGESRNKAMVSRFRVLSRCANTGQISRGISAVVIVCAMVVVGGCATIDREACLSADWEGLGYEDALSGYTADSRVKLHNSACSSQNIAVNRSEYEAGFAAGLGEFCLPQNALAFGLAQRAYQYHCPADTEEEFLIAYIDGLAQTHERHRDHELILNNRLVQTRFRLRFFEQIERHDPTIGTGENRFVARGHSVSRAIENSISNSQKRRVRLRNLINRANSVLQIYNQTL